MVFTEGKQAAITLVHGIFTWTNVVNKWLRDQKWKVGVKHNSCGGERLVAEFCAIHHFHKCPEEDIEKITTVLMRNKSIY